MHNVRQLFVAAFCLCLLSNTGRSDLVLTGRFEFNNNLADSLGNFASLSSLGGTVSNGEYTFGENQGLRLSSPITSGDYRIEMDFQFTTPNNNFFHKIVDFQSRSSDAGLYVISSSETSNRLTFYPDATNGTGAVFENTPITIAIQRESGVVTGFLNGVSQFSFTDSNNNAVSSTGEVHFFIDDIATGNSFETLTGSVSELRIFSPNITAVPEPSSIIGFGLLALLSCVPIVRRTSQKFTSSPK